MHLALAAAAQRARAAGLPRRLRPPEGRHARLLDTPYRRSVVDLVEVADEISVRHLQETLYTHREGVRLLLAPDEGERAEEVDSTVARNVLGAVRARHALTVVDLGATVSEATAIGAEMASKVLVVTTPDVVALRGVRRMRDLWRRLQVRDDDQDTLRRCSTRPRASARSSPTSPARSSAGGSRRRRSRPTSPPSRPRSTRARPAGWRTRSCAARSRRSRRELEAMPAADEPGRRDGEPRGLLARLSGERGQASVEFAGLLPLLFVIAAAAVADRADRLHVRARRPRRARGRPRARDRHDRRAEGQAVRGHGGRGLPEGVAQGRDRSTRPTR